MVSVGKKSNRQASLLKASSASQPKILFARSPAGFWQQLFLSFVRSFVLSHCTWPGRLGLARLGYYVCKSKQASKQASFLPSLLLCCFFGLVLSSTLLSRSLASSSCWVSSLYVLYVVSNSECYVSQTLFLPTTAGWRKAKG